MIVLIDNYDSFTYNLYQYIGIFNAIMGVSACIFIYLFVRKIDDNKYFKYIITSLIVEIFKASR